jgi:hypothetical protein
MTCSNPRNWLKISGTAVFPLRPLHALLDEGRPGPTDVWTTLAGLARETSRIRLGSLLTSVTFRHPGPLAIVVAQVDAMSQGRIEFGLGAGYFEPEHRAYGIPFPSVGERFDRLAEALELITGLRKSPAESAIPSRGSIINCSTRPPCPSLGKTLIHRSFSEGPVRNARPRWRPDSPMSSICRPAAVAHRENTSGANSKAKTSQTRSNWCAQRHRRSAGIPPRSSSP